MRNAFWTPREERERREERPYLQVPSPMDNRPYHRPDREREPEEDDAPRVIIIDI